MWARAIIAKVLVLRPTAEETTDGVNEFAKAWWERINDEQDGSLYISKVSQVPMDDLDAYLERAHYFITHPTTFELPFELKYPRERVYPACQWCHGTGEERPEVLDREGC